jgi:hypothetical protein
MSNEITDITLKFPCTEKWDTMKIVDGGRHCDTCKHKVVDFRNMTKEEYQHYIQNNQHVCGIFKKSQLSQRFLRYAAASVIAASLTATACSTPDIETTEQPVEETVEFVTTGIPIPPAIEIIPDTISVTKIIDVPTMGLPIVDSNDTIPATDFIKE